MGATLVARRAALLSLLSVVAAVALLVGVLGTATPGRASGFDPNESWAWSPSEQLLAAGVTAKAARLEVLPGGQVAALMLVAGSAYGQPSGDVLVTRVRSSSGTWGDPEVLSLGTEAPATRTVDTFADSSGRIVVVWAVKGTTGQWPVRSVSRSAEGTWGVPQELYVARTVDFANDTIEIAGIAPRLVPAGDTVTIAWATTTNASSSRVPVTDNPFRARRWTAGTWGDAITSDGYGADAADVPPMVPDQVTVWADPVRAARASDGRVSFVYSLRKQRATHTMNHPLSGGYTGPNVANVWDGVAERPWDSITNTAWVVHLDPTGGWSAPAKLVAHAGPPVACASPTLPSNPPLAAHWAEWKAFSASPGIRTSCPGEDSRPTSASYDDDGALRIQLDYSSDPSATIVLNQFLDKGCDDPGATSSTRFCFDDWEGTDWGVEWPTAGIAIAPGASRPAVAAIQATPLPPDRSTRVSTASGTVTVHEQADGGNAIRFERASGDVVWRPDPNDASALRVQHVFAHGDDVAVFYWRSSATSLPGCGMAVLRGGSTTVDAPTVGCLAASTSYLEDVVQLGDGRLVWVNGETTGSPVRVYGPGGPTSTEPTPTTPTDPSPSSPSPSPPSPSPPAPTAPAPSGPAPVPPATTFTATAPPTVTGKLKVGRTLTARPGTWIPTPTTVSFKWFADGKSVRRATSAKLRLTTKLEGKRISVRIILTRPGVTTTVRTVKVRGRVR